MSNELMKLDDVMTLGKALAESNYFSDAKQASQAIVKVLAGQELGIGPVASMTGIHIVQGNVVISGNIMASLVKSNPRTDYKILRHDETICEIEFWDNNEKVGVSTFSIDDANKANLTTKKGGAWKEYPRNMLFNRAMSNGVKWFFPFLTNGQAIYTPGELDEDEPLQQTPAPEFIIETPPEPINILPDGEQNHETVRAYVKTLAKTLTPMEKLKNVQSRIEDGRLEYDGELTLPMILEWSA